MKRLFFISILLFVFHAVDVQAANWYVRPSGGSGSGTSWTTAWNGLGAIPWSSVACGDTIWIAGGTYTQNLSPVKVCTSGNRLTIAAARSDSASCTASGGWLSSYDTAVNKIHQTGGSHIYYAGNLSYITVSGRTTASGGNHGWWVDLTGQSSGYGIEYDRSSSYTMTYTTTEYIDLQGPGHVTYTSDGRGIENTGTHDTRYAVFSHINIWNWESAVYCANNQGYATFEWLDAYDIEAGNWSSYHPNGIYTSGSNYGVVRYSKFHKGPNGYGTGEGIFVEQSGGSNNWSVYGNIFYDLDYVGVKAIEITANVSGWKIYNNTFDNVSVSPGEYSASCSSSEYRNNLFYATSVGSCGVASNNVTAGSGAFVNRAAKDYHIVSTVGAGYARNAGTNLSAYFTTDMDGTPFGGDGTWDVGAYEYGSAGAVVKPSAPLFLR